MKRVGDIAHINISHYYDVADIGVLVISINNEYINFNTQHKNNTYKYFISNDDDILFSSLNEYGILNNGYNSSWGY